MEKIRRKINMGNVLNCNATYTYKISCVVDDVSNRVRTADSFTYISIR